MSIRKTLNPSAEQWRSTPPPPPPTPLQQAVMVAPPGQLLFPLSYQQPFYLPAPTYWAFLPHYNLFSHPVYDQSHFYTAANPLTGNQTQNLSKLETESPRSEETPVRRQILPPRVQMCDGISRTEPPPPQTVSDGGPSRLRRPPSSDRHYRLHFSPTTVMIKNIPNSLRRDFMLSFLDRYCKSYNIAYDFLYLPMDFSKNSNLGYAFVNFTTPEAANKFKTVLDNYKWGVIHTPERTINSEKICETTWARIQGKAALVKRFRNINFCYNSQDSLPVVLDPPRDGSDQHPAPVVLGTLQRSHP